MQNAHDHVLLSTFPFDASFEDLVKDAATTRDITSHQERKRDYELDRIDRSKARLTAQWEIYQQKVEKNGLLFCCSKEHVETMNRCICIFSSKKALENHKKKNQHTFPKVDLSTNLQLLHLKGEFAFCLATGSMTNRSDVFDRSKFIIRKGNVMTRNKKRSWFDKGCYNAVRKKSKNATAALIADLDAMFLAGFDTDNELKSAKNKYTPTQALSFLANLKMENGRRKYSHDLDNRNGPLPSKQYIKSWFGRKAAEYKEEALDNNRNYADMKANALKKSVRTRYSLSRLSQNVICKLLLVKYNELYKNGSNESREMGDLHSIIAECKRLNLPYDGGKDAMVYLLELDDRVNGIKPKNADDDLELVIKKTLDRAEKYTHQK